MIALAAPPRPVAATWVAFGLQRLETFVEPLPSTSSAQVDGDSARFQPADTTWVRIVDGGRPNRRLIDRSDSPDSNRSQVSACSDSDHLLTAHFQERHNNSRRE